MRFCSYYREWITEGAQRAQGPMGLLTFLVVKSTKRCYTITAKRRKTTTVRWKMTTKTHKWLQRDANHSDFFFFFTIVCVQPLCVSCQQARLSRSAFLHRPPLHDHHLGALRPLRHLPDSGHQRLSGGLQHLPHPLRWRERRLLHQGENCYRAEHDGERDVALTWCWLAQITYATVDRTCVQTEKLVMFNCNDHKKRFFVGVRWIYWNRTNFLLTEPWSVGSVHYIWWGFPLNLSYISYKLPTTLSHTSPPLQIILRLLVKRIESFFYHQALFTTDILTCHSPESEKA